MSNPASMPNAAQEVITIDAIAKRFGRHHVLEDVSLRVNPGEIFAFLGRNGAGKTTAIRMLLGLIKPDAGTIEVLGLDPGRHALEIRRRVGYLAEEQQMWPWMSVEQVIGFMAPFYPRWDHALAKRYLHDFELPAKTRVRNLSKGQSVRLGLLLALAPRPELVILDDPALGLDPIMRKEFNRDVIEHLQGEGHTVFYSSHLLYEVEPVADRVAILDRGRIVRVDATETLREQVRQIVFPAEVYQRLDVPLHQLDVRRAGHETAVVIDEAADAIVRLKHADVPHRVVDLSLDEIFEAFVIGRVEDDDAPTPPAVSATGSAA